MNPTDLINALTHSLSQNLFNLLFQFILIGVIIMLLKTCVEALVGFILFRIDNHTSIGSPVEIYGKKGRIKNVGIFEISVETEDGFIRIPSKAWRTSRVINLKDNSILNNRRSTDKPC